MTNPIENFPRAITNWEEKLLPTDVIVRKEDGREVKVVPLKALQRLAREAGLYKSDCKFNFVSAADTGTIGIMQAIYRAEFTDGSEWVGAADCNSGNTSGKFIYYPTAVAESRAEARCLRKALGISILSSEEIGFVEGAVIEQIEAAPGKKVDSQVVKAIEKLIETRGVPTAEVLEAILSKERNSSVFELNELTVDEGQKAMTWLNDQKVTTKVVKQSAAEERAAKKQELLARTKDEK